jgi:signal peptidase II
VGNLADRLFRADAGILSGAVVDFIDLQWWPVFNLADTAIVCGAILLLLTSVREPRPEAAAGA